MVIAECIAQLQSLGLDRLDAQLLLLHALHRPTHDRAWLVAHDTDPVDADTLARVQDLAHRRLRGEPLAYLTGHKEFFGLDLVVDSRVLVPRPDTEVLVEWALEVMPPSACVLDLGTGSGAIALALKHTQPDARICAIDCSPDALDVAQANARRLNLAVEFQCGSWLDPVHERVDLIVSNPPYISQGDAHLDALVHEPGLALTSGTDGLDALRTIIAQSPAHLKVGGWLLLEHGYDQAEPVRTLLLQAGFTTVQSRRDLAGIERCTGGQLAHG